MELDNQVALVTGAAQGIGRGIAEALAAAGAQVVINDLKIDERAQEVAAAIAKAGGEAMLYEADVSNRQQMEKMFADVIERFGRLDIAVANAGFSIRKPFVELSWDDALATLEVTQFGTWHTCQLAAIQMVKQHEAGQSGGKIIIISSIHQEHPCPDAAPYNMGKAAVNQLGRSIAVELAPYKINVNIIDPGWIDTPGERRSATGEELREYGKSIPWGRLGTPEDIAHSAVFLASPRSEYLTGSVLRVDGGFMPGMTLPPPPTL